MCVAQANSRPPPTTAPCSTDTTGTRPNSTRSNARCHIIECSTPSTVLRSVSSARSSPAQKWSPSAARTTACTPAGTFVKNASTPSTVASLSALRFSGRASHSTATSSRTSARSDGGRDTGSTSSDIGTPPVLFPQSTLEQLARGVVRQRLDDDPRLRDLVFGEPAGEEGEDVVRRGGRSGTQRHHGPADLSPPLVRNADDGA